jgi:hypothetical protein
MSLGWMQSLASTRSQIEYILGAIGGDIAHKFDVSRHRTSTVLRVTRFCMAPKRSLLEQMEDNPRADWDIEDVKTLCTQLGLTYRRPSSGSHYVVLSEKLRGALTIPARRPIKAPYIKKLAALARSHVRTKED